jgi:acyl-CoA thioesterase II
VFELVDLLAGLEMDVQSESSFAAPNWDYYGSSAGGQAAAAITDLIAGGQILAQAVVAARRLQRTKTVKSIHAVFARAGRVSESTEVAAQTIQDGRTTGTVVFTFFQRGRSFATATVMLHVPDLDVIRHSQPRPDVATPTDGSLEITARGSHDVALIDAIDARNDELSQAASDPMWVRFADAPDDDAVSQALLAFVTNFHLVGVAMRPHAGLSQDQSHINVTTGVLAHTVSFHESFSAADWLLLDQRVPWAGNGRFFGVGDVFTDDGALIASFTQEGLLRGLAERHGENATL